MRKVTFVFIAFVISVSAIADPITPRQAIKLAMPYMDNQIEEPLLVRKATRKSPKKMSLGSEEVAPYYIYSRGEGRGFVIISGDDALPEVLGYTESGDFDENDLPPFLVWYLDYYGNLAEAAQDAGAKRMTTQKYASNRVDIEPLIETHWNQGAPYNGLCPLLKNSTNRCVTGCVATAAAQVLYYWRKDLPTYTQATVSSYTKGDAQATQTFAKGTPIMWDLMRPSYSGSEPAEYRDAVATLMAVVGGAAKLTYGSSTSGYTSDIVGVNSTYFKMNGGTRYAKDYGGAENNYSDDAWATLLYNELLKSHPIMYSGVKDGEGGGGHAVVVDGYKASSGLFHFNLGWGGSSDGYYTVARGKSPSWGFNDSWQECIIGACPKTQNLKASIIVPPTMYKNRTNVVKIKIENHGTLPYSGIYLHGNTTGKKPTTLGTAKSSDKDTELSADGSEYLLQMNVKPTSDKYYLFVTDEQLNVITSATFQTTESENELWFNGIDIAGSADYQDGFRIVYHEKTAAEATIANKSDVAYEGVVKASLYGSSDGGKSFKLVGNKSTKVNVPANGETTASFSLVSSSGCPIRVDSLYKVIMTMETADNIVLNRLESIDTVARFILKGPDMEVMSFEDRCVKLSGHWDPLYFNTTIKKSAYKTATSYDLTEVSSIDNIPESPVNPNALFYVSNGNIRGKNIVYQNKCMELDLTPGMDFVPKAGFTSQHATLNIGQQANKWYLITAPCRLNVPDGILARNIESHVTSGINNKTNNVKVLEAGRTYLIITTSSYRQMLSGENTDVVTEPIENTDTALVGTFVNSTTPVGSFLIDMGETQYFQPVEEGSEVESLRGYFIPSNIKKAFKASSNIVQDPTYQTLGQDIQFAYKQRDMFQDIVTEEAYAQLTDSILKAEAMYSAREASNLSAKLAATNLKDKVKWYMTQLIDPTISPIDYTSGIANPSFETGNTNGWTIEATNYATVRSASNINFKGVGADGNYLLYNIKSSDLSGCGISQSIEGLPAGYYKLTAMLGSSNGQTITLFANDSTTTVQSHPFGQFYLTEAVIENIHLNGSEKLTIGVKGGSWYKADDFRLYYTSRDATGIDEITSPETRLTIKGTYDIMGRAVNDTKGLKSGIYIINGKKVLIK